MTILKQFRLIISIIILSSLLLSCKNPGRNLTETTRRIEMNPHDPIPQRINQLGFDLHTRLIEDQNQNLVFSPFSIASAMAMTYVGARNETAEEMAATLYFSPDQAWFHQHMALYIEQLRSMAGEKTSINIANSLWAQYEYPFLPSFFDTLKEHYGPRLFRADFYRGDRAAIAGRINAWVEDETRGKIRDLLSAQALTEDTRLVLVNALHFLSAWMVTFDEKLTKKDNFYTLSQGAVQRDFMFRSDDFRLYEDELFQMIELPYERGFSMLVLLPRKNVELKDLEKNLTARMLADGLDNMQVYPTEVWMPKFSIESKANLEQLLGGLGMPLAFSNRADFSGMTGNDSLKIDKVIHQAMIEVNEAGTEAAAATAVIMVRKTSIMPVGEKKTFRADRPFVFAIKENRDNGILFLGRVAIP